MYREKYELPVTEIIKFETEDVITTSFGVDNTQKARFIDLNDNGIEDIIELGQ